MEVELVISKVTKHLLDLVESLQGASGLALAKMAFGALDQEPVGLHLDKVVQRIGNFGTTEEDDSLFGFGHLVGAQHVLCALAVDESVLKIQLTRLVHGLHGRDVVASMLQDASFCHVQLHKGRGVLNSFVDEIQRLVRIALEVVVLCQKVPRPENGSRRLHNRTYHIQDDFVLALLTTVTIG